MKTTRREFLGIVALVAVPAAAVPFTGHGSGGTVYQWRHPSNNNPYKKWHSPETPLLKGLAKWSGDKKLDEQINSQLLRAMRERWFEEVVLTPQTPLGDRTWPWMIFGRDHRMIKNVRAVVEVWPPKASRVVRRYAVETPLGRVIYDVPQVCGNPAGRIVWAAAQPQCIPRPTTVL
jgi:hypothetical protein